jgi:tetratricopeptide (TPR) repeat protein
MMHYVVSMTMKQNYDSADQYLDSILKKSPDDIDALYLKLIVLQSKLADYESYVIDSHKSISLAESFLSKAEKYLTSATGDELHKVTFFKGNIYGFLSLVRIKSGSAISGLKEANISNDILKNLIKQTDAFPDAFLGTGMFDYYLGYNLKWIPGLEKRASTGLANLYKATNTDSPFRYGAQSTLLWILIERGEFKKADSIAQNVLKEYPQNSLFLQIRSRAVFGAKDYEKAVSLSKSLIAFSKNRKQINYTDILSGYQLIVSSCLKQGLKNDALIFAEEGLSLTIPSYALKLEWIKKHREYLLNVVKNEKHRK